MKTDVEFTVSLRKSVYEKSQWNTPEAFIRQLALMRCGGGHALLKRGVDRLPAPEQAKYEGLLETIKDLGTKLSDSSTFEALSESGEFSETKVRCSFDYRENPEHSAAEIADVEIFSNVIVSAEYLAENLEKMADPDIDGKAKQGAAMYAELARSMKQARASLRVNGIAPGLPETASAARSGMKP